MNRGFKASYWKEEEPVNVVGTQGTESPITRGDSVMASSLMGGW